VKRHGKLLQEALDTLPGKEAAFAFAFGKNQAVSSISLGQSLLLTRFRKV